MKNEDKSEEIKIINNIFTNDKLQIQYYFFSLSAGKTAKSQIKLDKLQDLLFYSGEVETGNTSICS